jgi:hypothetical protein
VGEVQVNIAKGRLTAQFKGGGRGFGVGREIGGGGGELYGMFSLLDGGGGKFDFLESSGIHNSY